MLTKEVAFTKEAKDVALAREARVVALIKEAKDVALTKETKDEALYKEAIGQDRMSGTDLSFMKNKIHYLKIDRCT